MGANGSGKSSLFAMLLGTLDPDEGNLALNPSDRISHVAQESPSGSRSAIDFVIDGDHELREIQAAIEQSEREGKDVQLHDLTNTLNGWMALLRKPAPDVCCMGWDLTKPATGIL